MKLLLTLRPILVSAFVLLFASAQAQPSAPNATAATDITSISFRANWTSTSGATGYYLDISTSSTFSSFIESYNAWFTNIPFHYLGGGLTPGTRYYYRVRVQTSSGISGYSNTISVVTELPPVATGATEIGITSFRANWNALAGTTTYLLDVSTSPSFSSFVSGFNGAPQTGLSKLVTGLTPGANYWYRVRISGMTSTSGIINARTIGPPAAWAATDVNMTRFRAEWSSEPSATAYYLDVSMSSSFASFLPGYNGLTLTSTTKFLTGLTPGTTYYYRVRAATSVGITPNSNIVSVTTPTQPLVINQNYNHIRITDASVAGKANAAQLESASVQERTTEYKFFDALGRPMQTVAMQASPTQKDVIQPMAYDEYGRETRKYLPYVDGSGDGQFKTGALGDWGLQRLFYQEGVKVAHDELPYTQTQFESSPVERALQVAGTGAAWKNAPGTQLPAYTQSWSYNDFLPAPVSGSGNVTVTLANNVLTIDFNATFANSPLKTGNIVLIDIPTLPDLDLGSIGQGAYHAYVRDRYLYVESIFAMHYPATMFGASGVSRVVYTKTLLPTIVPRATQYAHQLNGTNEVLLFRHISPTTTYPLGLVQTGTGTTPAYYAPNMLTKTITTDEDFHEVIEYKDKKGKIIVKRVQVVTEAPISDTNYASTYYIYDEYDQLVCVLSPEAARLLPTQYYQSGATDATREAFLSRWAFRYAYDTRRRMVIRQVPGTAPTYMVYDNRDRVALTQDGNQRATSPYKWTFTKYDEFNRPVMTGIKDTTVLLTQAAMQGVVNTYYSLIASTKPWRKYGEKYVGTVAGNVHGYTNVAYPQVTTAAALDVNSYLTVTYYDTYDFRAGWMGEYQYVNDNLAQTPASGVTYTQPVQENARVNGYVTGKKEKLLAGTSSVIWLKSVNYYDHKYRPIQVKSDQYKRGISRVSNLYDFTGKVLKTKTTHVDNYVTWKDMVGAIVIDHALVKTGTTSVWDAGAVSVQQIAANADGWLEFTASETSLNRMIGFSDQNTSNHHNTIDYAIYLSSARTLAIYENGASKASFPASYNIGDMFRIERTAGVVRYYRNDILLYTSLVTSTTLLMADVSLYLPNAAATEVRIAGSTVRKTVTRTFAYDHSGRLTHTWHMLDDGPEILLSKQEYNELGQLVDKKLHSTLASATDNKQSIDYRYNIRGWLTSINNPSLTNDGLINDDVTDYFGMNVSYDAVESDLNNAAVYNGNISAIKWSNYGDATGKQKAYSYSYDRLNRIAGSTFREKASGWSLPLPNSGFAESGLEYDLNGNIQRLTRNDKRAEGTMDVLTYNYGSGTTLSNKLLYVADAGDVNKGFADGNPGTATDYTYDVNGNLTRDLNNGIGNTVSDATNRITYNLLNLPETITKSGNVIRYIYDADGTKLSQLVTMGTRTRQTDYVGDFVYENDVLQFVNHDEGRIVTSSTTLLYTNQADVTTDFTSANATLDTATLNGGETYVTVTSDGTVARTGAFPVGGTFIVASGERYKIRVKGYRTGSNAANVLIQTGGNDLNWPGAALPLNAKAESWVEQTVVIPAGATTLQVGVAWPTVTAGQMLYINEVEISKIETAAPEYQYHLKDYLGNVRVTFTTKQEVDADTATLESVHADAEQANFLRYDNARIVANHLFDHTNGSAPGTASGGAQRLNGRGNEVFGLARSISVMPGDVIDMEVYAKYIDSNSGNRTTALNTLLLQIAAGTATAGTVVDGSNYATSTSSFPYPPGGNGTGNSTGAGPKAYLNWLVYDRNFALITSKSGYARMTTAARETGQNVNHEKLTGSITIGEAGYIYIYLSNEEGAGAYEVYFDDFKVAHTKSPVIQSDDYYPFGLTFNGYTRENSTPNDYKFSGKEEQNELGLNIVDFGLRMYDPTIARWMVIDPLAHKLYAWSTYNYALNNPILFVDPDGALPWPVHIRSFISTPTTGGGSFRGDGRGPTTESAPQATSRVRSSFTVDPAKGTVTPPQVKSDPTVFFGVQSPQGSIPPMVKEGKPEASVTNVKSANNTTAFDFSHSGKDPITPSFTTPALDVHASLSITEDINKGVLNINGTFTGDIFPSTEAFIVDQSGNGKVFLGAQMEEGGITDLFGDNKKPLFKVNIQVTFDSKGNFTGVQQGGKKYTVKEWNKLVLGKFKKK
jgi:RHS repeat-associated protein